MKFSDLTAGQRTQLAALAASGPGLTTDRLSKAAPFSGDNSAGAHSLCGLRALGLVYSENPNGSKFCNWRITSVGMAVFVSRPDGEVKVQQPVVQSADQAEAPRPVDKIYRVYTAFGEKFDEFTTAQEQAAIDRLQELATANPGREFKLVTTIAVAFLPAPVAKITRV